MTDVKNDPFAAVAAQQAASTPPPPAAAGAPSEDPFVSAHDSDDPFATSEDFRGGPFTPTPPIELLRGRLVAMFPRKFEANADNPFKDQPGAEPTREQYTVDMYILDGGPLEFDYKVKGDPNKGTKDTYEKFDAGTPTPAAPFVIKNNWIPQGNLIAKLKGSHRKGAPYLAVLEVGAQANDRKKGTSDAQIREEFDAWIKRNRVGNKPKYSWLGDVPTPERRKLAIEFWAAHKAEIEPINVATAPTESK
jgi:hypothetical protein